MLVLKGSFWNSLDPSRESIFRINSNSRQHTTQRTRIKADSDPAMTPLDPSIETHMLIGLGI